MYVHIYYIAQAYRVYCGDTVVVTCTIPSCMHGSGGKSASLVLHNYAYALYCEVLSPCVNNDVYVKTYIYI